MKIFFDWILHPLRRPFFILFLTFNTIVACLVAIIVSQFERKGNLAHDVGKYWSLLNIFLSGTRLKIKGKEKINKNLTYIVMSNHQSLIDVWALFGKIPLQFRWIVKSEIRKVPIFGYTLERAGHIYIDRKNRESASISLETASRKINKGTSVIIFPEGTRSEDGHLLRFRMGGAIIALKSGVPILPVTINGSRFVLPKNTLAVMPGKIEIVVGDVIDPSGYDENNQDELMEKIKEAIEKNLDLEYGKLT